MDLHTKEETSDAFMKFHEQLEQEEAYLQNLFFENEHKQEKCRQTVADLERNLKELEDKHHTINTRKNMVEAALQSFQKEKVAIVRILTAYQLSEENLFDKEIILSLLHSAAENYNKLIQDRRLDNILLGQQQELYQSGKVFELPKELRCSFEKMDIQVEYGYEWLRNLSDNKRINNGL